MSYQEANHVLSRMEEFRAKCKQMNQEEDYTDVVLVWCLVQPNGVMVDYVEASELDVILDDDYFTISEPMFNQLWTGSHNLPFHPISVDMPSDYKEGKRWMSQEDMTELLKQQSLAHKVGSFLERNDTADVV